MSKICLSDAHEDASWIHDRLYEYNLTKSGNPRSEITLEPDPALHSLVFFPDDDTSEPVGGCVWRIRPTDHVFFVEFLWISDTLRGTGAGSRLLCAAEEKARAFACAAIELTTNTFQAPDFYQKRGYDVVKEVAEPTPNCPENIHYTFRKTLAPPSTES